MKFCEKCGAELEENAKFCRSCGTAIDSNFGIFTGEVLGANNNDIEKNKGMGIISYIGILFIIPLVAAKDSKFARYHANQGLVIFLAVTILSFACGIVSAMPFIGFMGGILSSIVTAVAFIYEILGIISAAKGEMKELPFVGRFKIIKL